MQMNHTVLGKLVIAVAALPLLGCSEMKNPPFSIENGVLIVRTTAAEVAQSRKALLEVTEDNVPSDMAGASVFDCSVVAKLSADFRGQPVVEVKIEHVYAGGEQLHDGVVKLISPQAKDGGVNLSVGARYRVSAVKLDDNAPGLYVWSGTAVELQSSKAPHL
jgi:hypothetical protein